MYVVFILLCFVLILLAIEKFIVDRNVKKFIIRVHVNGTRGKSTVVRYISSLLRQNGIKTFSKITGVVPTYFTNDESPHVIKRRGGARVTEQFKMISQALANGSDAFVLECMSINPELQRIESRMLNPHYYVITNIREDHQEVMGLTEDEWVDSICSAIPKNCVVITAETKHLPKIKEYAVKVNSRVTNAKKFDLPEDVKKITGIVEDNLLITLALANELQINPGKIFENIPSNDNIIGKNSVCVNGFDVNFYNGFAINDVPSAEVFINEIKNKMLPDDKLFVVFNSRADRPLRSIRLANMIFNSNVDLCIIAGNHKQAAYKELTKKGMQKEKLLVWYDKQCKSVKENLKGIVTANTSLIGIGNIKGDGFEIINSINNN